MRPATMMAVATTTAACKTQRRRRKIRRHRVVDWPHIIEQHGPDVWRTAYRLLSNFDDATDCYQETFLKAVSYARQNEVVCWSAALRRIATARAIDQLRRRYRNQGKRERLTVMDEPAAAGPAPDEHLALRELIDLLREGLAEIPPIQAQAFWLTEVELLNRSDVAGEMNATPQQVATWLHRAKRKLRKYLAERGVLSEVRK